MRGLPTLSSPLQTLPAPVPATILRAVRECWLEAGDLSGNANRALALIESSPPDVDGALEALDWVAEQAGRIARLAREAAELIKTKGGAA